METATENATTHACPTCGKETPNERQEILGVETCKDCTEQPKIDLSVLEIDLDLRAGEVDIETPDVD